jgi:hypothetical protein
VSALLDSCRPVTLEFWANRFGEVHGEGDPGFPGVEVVVGLVDRLYPENPNVGVETAFVATLDDVLGVMLEYEFNDGYCVPPAIVAHWCVAAPEGARFLVYGAPWSLDGRPVFGAFVPAETGTRELVHRCADLMFEWGSRA